MPHPESPQQPTPLAVGCGGGITAGVLSALWHIDKLPRPIDISATVRSFGARALSGWNWQSCTQIGDRCTPFVVYREGDNRFTGKIHKVTIEQK
jgi:hypothetical protein